MRRKRISIIPSNAGSTTVAGFTVEPPSGSLFDCSSAAPDPPAAPNRPDRQGALGQPTRTQRPDAFYAKADSRFSSKRRFRCAPVP